MGYDEEYDDSPKFNKPAVAVGHVAKSTFKWALIGAAIGAALLIGVGAAVAVGSGPIGWIAGGIAHFLGIGGGAGGWLASGLITGLTWGGVAGAVGGGISGLMGMDDAVATEGERLQVARENYNIRRESNAELANRHAMQALEVQKQFASMTPPMGRGMGQGGGQELG